MYNRVAHISALAVIVKKNYSALKYNLNEIYHGRNSKKIINYLGN